MQMKIAVAGTGYVGLSIATLLSQHHQVMAVDIQEEEKQARVIVKDDQLSLAIGKAGQNARLAARLTGWKIDIKSETQFREMLANMQEGEITEKNEEQIEEE